MEEQKNEKKKSKISLQTAVIGVLSVVVIAGGIAIFYILNHKDTETAAMQRIGMEAGVVTNEEDADGIEINDPFSFTTLYDRDIRITGGKNAVCYIGNSEANYYEDMYVQIYLNDENDQMAEEIYVSGIIPRGSHIEFFTAEKELEPGTYRGTLIHSCVDKEGALAGDNAVIVDIYVAD